MYEKKKNGLYQLKVDVGTMLNTVGTMLNTVGTMLNTVGTMLNTVKN